MATNSDWARAALEHYIKWRWQDSDPVVDMVVDTRTLMVRVRIQISTPMGKRALLDFEAPNDTRPEDFKMPDVTLATLSLLLG